MEEKPVPLKVVIAGLHFQGINHYLRKHLPEAEVVRASDKELLDGIEDADILIPTMCRIDRNHFSRARRLRLVQQWGSGLEGVDIAAATASGVAVANVPTQGTGNAESVAEWCVMAAIALSRAFPAIQQQVRDGFPWGSPSGRSLAGRTAGLIGLGGIGKALALRLQPFKMNLVGCKRFPADFPGGEYGLSQVLGMEGLDEILAVSDYLFLCLPLTPETRDMIGERELALLPGGSFLLNPSRGGLVNRVALMKALDSGHLAGAALDVFWEEPTRAGDPDLEHPKMLCTPHIAGTTDLSYDNIARQVVDNIIRVMRGFLPQNCANPGTKSGRQGPIGPFFKTV